MAKLDFWDSRSESSNISLPNTKKLVLDNGFSNSQEADSAAMLHVSWEWSSHCLTRGTYSTLLPHLNWDRDNTEVSG